MQIPELLKNKGLNDWSVDDVAEWLSFNSIPQDKVDIIKGEEIDGMALKELDRPTLKEIGIAPLGPVIKIHGLIRALVENVNRESAIQEKIYSIDGSQQVSPTQQTFQQPGANQFPLSQPVNPSAMNNNQPFISSTQPNITQNNHPFTGNSSIPPPYAYHQNTNNQLNLSSNQQLNGSQAEANSASSNYTTSVKTEPINPLLVSVPKVKQEPNSQAHLLNSQAPTTPNLNLVEKSEQQRELNILLENFQETWKHQLNPSLLKRSTQIHAYCNQKTSKITNSIDILLNNRILPTISLLTQANLKREGLESVIQNLAKFVGSYRILVWIRDLVDTSDSELSKVFNAGDQLTNSSKETDTDTSYNWSEAKLDELLNISAVHISQLDYFKPILEDCESRTPDIQLDSHDINELILSYLKKRNLYFLPGEGPLIEQSNQLQLDNISNVESKTGNIQHGSHKDFPPTNRYISEIRDHITQKSSDRYSSRASSNREASPEPYRENYSPAPRSSHASETSEFYEDSRPRGRVQSSESYESSRFGSQRASNNMERSSSYNDRNKSSSLRMSNFTSNQPTSSTIKSSELKNSQATRDSLYNSPSNEKISRPSFSFKEISKINKPSLPKQSIANNSIKPATVPTFCSPRKGPQLLPPFSNRLNTPVSIKSLALDLQPHQISGVEFLWKTIVEKGHGAILAHAMGLGKTGQIYTFLNTLRYYIRISSNIIPDNLKPFKVLILTPASLQENWLIEFQKWTNFVNSAKNQSVHLPIPISLGESPPKQRISRLQDWTNNGGICIISHSLFRNCVQSSDFYERQFEELLVNKPGASLVVIDEAHVLKEEDSMIRTIAKKFKTPSRIMLTGYPMQNNLTEYYCMSKFVKDNIFDSLQTFNNEYRAPIIKGLYSPQDSPERILSDKKLYKLAKLLEPIVHRVNSDIIKDQIPKKSEYAICCYLSPIQFALYKAYTELFQNTLQEVQFLEKGNLLQLICNLPIHKDLIIKSNEESGNNEVLIPGLKTIGSRHTQDLLKEIEKLSLTSNDIKNNPKFHILTELIQEFLLNDEKMLIFSKNIKSLLAIQSWLEQNISQKSLLLTGETVMEDRQVYVNRINEEDEYKILLASVNVGGVGFTVTGATRVIIYDVGYNPCVIEQAIARSFRIGQTKNIHVYRLFTFDTWEARLNTLNEHKNTLILRTLDQKNSDIDSVDQKEMKKYFKVPEYRLNEEQVINTEDPLLQRVLNRDRDLVASCLIHREEPSEHNFDITAKEMREIEREVAIQFNTIF